MIFLEIVLKKQHGIRGTTRVVVWARLLFSVVSLQACEPSGSRRFTDPLTNRALSGTEVYLGGLEYLPDLGSGLDRIIKKPVE